jgi:hypothetical protein
MQHELLFLWTRTLWAALAGHQAVCQLPHAWLEYGPPDVVHLHAPGRRPTTAVYTISPRCAACTDLRDTQAPLVWVELVFPDSANSGHAYVCSIDGPHEVLGLAGALGLPDQLVLVTWGYPAQGIRRARAKLPLSARLLLPLYCPLCRAAVTADRRHA